MSYSPLNSTNITAALGFTPLSASTLPALTGDVTMGVNTTVTAIAANAVTNAKAAQMATNTLKGNNTGATANALDLTVAQVQTMLGAGAASGLATLDGTGKVPTAQLPSSVTGAMSYQGTWNASTNTPALVSGTGTKGFLYKVATAGTTALDGVSQWNVGDQVVFDGTTWDKIDGLASEVVSVAGRVGAVVIANTDVSGLGTMSTQAASAVAITGGTIANVRTQVHVSVLTIAGNYTGVTADFGGVIVINKTVAAATTVTLPPSPVAGDTCTVKDGKGDANTNNITVQAAAGNIDGAASAIINGARTSLAFVYTGTEWGIV